MLLWESWADLPLLDNLGKIQLCYCLCVRESSRGRYFPHD